MSIQFYLDDVAGFGALSHRKDAGERKNLTASQRLSRRDVIIAVGQGGRGGRQGEETSKKGERRMAPGQGVGFHAAIMAQPS